MDDAHGLALRSTQLAAQELKGLELHDALSGVFSQMGPAEGRQYADRIAVDARDRTADRDSRSR